MVKNLPAKRKTCICSLSQEDPLEKEMSTSPVFCLRNPMENEPSRLQSMGSQRVSHN